MKKIIITADDFGMCQAVDNAIIDLIELGVLSTTNVITNMESLENAKILRKKYNQISLGIHWNVTTGKPVSDIGLVNSLVDTEGYFYPVKEFKKRMRSGKIIQEHLEIELNNQYEMFQKYCGKADYWNTHENSVLNIQAYNVFSRVAKKLEIESTRNFQRVYLDYDLISGSRKIREMFVKAYIDIWFGKIIKHEFSMPEGRLISFKPESKVDLERLQKSLKDSTERTVELVLHPATTTEHYLFGNIGKSRYDEYLFFKNDNMIKFLKDYTIVNFTEL